MMSARAGLHHNRASSARGEELDHLLAAEFFAEDSIAFAVLSMEVERVLAQIDSNQRDVLHDGLT